MRLLSTGILLSLAVCTYAQPQTSIVKGVIDLRSHDFSGGSSINLDGEWDFYWNQLITPGHFPESTEAYFHFPSLWRGTKINDSQLSNVGYATYRLKVLVNPAELPPMAISLNEAYTSIKVFVNGDVVAQNGMPGTTKESTVPKWLPKTVPLDNLTDTTTIVLHVSNFHHSKGGAMEPLIFGTYENLLGSREAELFYVLTLTGALIMGGLFFLGLYLFGRHDTSILYFSLFCLTYSYRIIGTDIYALHSLFPLLDWFVTIRLEYVTLFLSAFFFGCYTLALYPQEANKTLINLLSVVSLVCLAISVIFPPSIFTHLVEPFFLILLIYIGYAAYVYSMAVFKKRDGAIYASISTDIVLAVFVYRILVYFNIAADEQLLTFFGYVGFFFFQSLILIFRFSNSLKKAISSAEESSRIKSEFLSTMSHEIRTPMNAVIGLTNFILEDNPKKDHVESLNTLKFSAENLLVIINDILDYNKIDAGKIIFEKIPVDIRDLMGNIENSMAPKAIQKGLTYKTLIDPDLPNYIYCDSTRTTQVLLNLLSNAIKFTHSGSIGVTLEMIQKINHQVEISFTVEDTGIGIPENKIQLIFDQFTQASSSTTRKFGGTGLGLAICKKLLDLQDTQLLVDSTFGKGSRFFYRQTFDICSKEEFDGSIAEVERGLFNLEDLRILLVEDSMINVMVAMKFLTKWGIKVDHVENGKLAVERLQNHQYDLILMDLQMPIMDGYQAVEEIRKMGIQIPIIALTASAMLDVKQKIMTSGMNGFVMKPFRPEELYQEISSKVSLN
ncbi:MAG: response regulator [Cyclobacteriaceae bacterium]